MIKPVQSLLFATNLTQECRQALEYSVSMGMHFNAVIYMLHVIEDLPDFVEDRMQDLLGKHQWKDIADAKQDSVKKSLLGKQTISAEIREKLREVCKSVRLDDSAYDLQYQQIIVSKGDVAENILEKAKENNCDLIVMGARSAYFAGNNIGTTIKSVLKNSPVAVSVVPSKNKKED